MYLRAAPPCSPSDLLDLTHSQLPLPVNECKAQPHTPSANVMTLCVASGLLQVACSCRPSCTGVSIHDLRSHVQAQAEQMMIP
jgi:hypothetical protein